MSAPRIVVKSLDGKRELGHLEVVNGLAVLSLLQALLGGPTANMHAKSRSRTRPLSRSDLPPSSSTWPWVLAFAHRMEAKLEANRHKGDREGWLKDSAVALLLRLEEEARELRTEILVRDQNCSPSLRITEEAADVANFAMMIADVVGGLCPCDPENGPPEDDSDSCGKCVRGGR